MIPGVCPKALVLLLVLPFFQCGHPPEPGGELTEEPGSSASDPAILARLETVLQTEPDLQIGVFDGPGPDVFGTIAEVLVDSMGGLVVLDRDQPTVLWFDVDGEFRGSAGRGGSGPGEFRSVKRMALGSLGRIHVLDGARRITTFEQSDSGFLFLDSFSSTLPLEDFCELDNRVFVHTPRHESILGEMEVGGEDELIRGFGDRLTVKDNDDIAHLWDHPIMGDGLRSWQNRGQLLCVASPPTFVVVPHSMPWVRAFHASGRALWRWDLDDFRKTHYWAPGGGAAVAHGVDPRTGTVHQLQAVALLDSKTFAASYRESSLTDHEGVLEVRVLSLGDGRELLRVRNARLAIAGVTAEGHLVGFSNYPFPHLGLYRHALSPRN
jgi:hypothetical protein